MRTIARFMDARNTAEGKFLSVMLSVLLVFSFLNVTMFTDYANAVDEETTVEETLGMEVDDADEAETDEEVVEPETDEPEPASVEEPAEPEQAAEEVTQTPAEDEVSVEFEIENATVSVADKVLTADSNVSVQSGVDLKFTVKADKGFELESVKADEKNVVSQNGAYTVAAAGLEDLGSIVVKASAIAKQPSEQPASEPESETAPQPAEQPAAEIEQPVAAEPVVEEESGIHRNPVVQIVFEVGGITLAHSEFLTNGETVQLPFVANPDGKILQGWEFSPEGSLIPRTR